jgi:hypothetical protein
MSRLIVRILRRRGTPQAPNEWWVRVGEHTKSYATQADAKADAMALAKAAWAQGTESQVLMQAPDGTWTVEHTCGADPERANS